jgi:HD superfamily phosphohydrolase
MKKFNVPVRDILWGHIYLTEGLAALTETPAFLRLHRIMQLGPAFRVYPGATHTRAAHSLGVYWLGKRMLDSLAGEGADAWMSPVGYMSFLTACLLHDLGHFPYAHSLKELTLRSHEDLTAEMIRSEPLRSAIGAVQADPDMVASIIYKKAGPAALPQFNADGEMQFYRNLLSGALDPDKLDYLNRDARCCGVPYGAQDVDYIISRLHPDRERGVSIDSRGLPCIESLLFSKYLMYRSVYWHRDVRAATAMVKKAILCLMEARQLSSEELYNLDDQGLFSLLAQKLDTASEKDKPYIRAALQVREGPLWKMAAEYPYDEAPLEALDAESNAGLCIVDIPEPISFETGLFLNDSVFTETTARTFVHKIRTIRIFKP